MTRKIVKRSTFLGPHYEDLSYCKRKKIFFFLVGNWIISPFVIFTPTLPRTERSASTTAALLDNHIGFASTETFWLSLNEKASQCYRWQQGRDVCKLSCKEEGNIVSIMLFVIGQKYEFMKIENISKINLPRSTSHYLMWVTYLVSVII